MGTPDQRGGERNRRRITMQRCAATRELHRERGERFVAKEGKYLALRRRDERLSADASKLRGAHIWFKKDDNRLWMGILHEVGSTDRPFVVRLLDNPGPVKVTLQPTPYSTDRTAARMSWCLQ